MAEASFSQAVAGWPTPQAVWWRGWKHPTIHKVELEDVECSFFELE